MNHNPPPPKEHPTMTSTDQMWLTPSKAAPLLGVTAAKVRELCASRQIARRNLGTAEEPRYSIHVDAIAAFNREAAER